MATAFSKLLAQSELTAGRAALTVPEDWMQGRSVFGGLQVALAVQAMRTLVPAVPLRTLQATFVAPVPAGRMEVRAEALRTGKSATHVEARIVAADGGGGAGATQAIVIGVFGAARTSAVAHTPVRPEVVPSRERPFVAPPGPGFAQHFAVRWLRGSSPFRGNPALEHVVEINMSDADGVTATEAHAIAIADFIPPIGLAHLTSPAPGSTLTWMVEFLTESVAGLALAGWRVDAQLVAARDGYTSQSNLIWGPGGEAVAVSRQSMLVFG